MPEITLSAEPQLPKLIMAALESSGLNQPSYEKALADHLKPRMTHWGQTTILTNLRHLFDLKNGSSVAIAAQAVKSMRELPGAHAVDRIYFLRSSIEAAIRAELSSDESLNLSGKMLMVVHSIAKTRMHIENTGEARYNKIFAEELGVTFVDKTRVVASSVQQAALNFVDICHRAFAK